MQISSQAEDCDCDFTMSEVGVFYLLLISALENIPLSVAQPLATPQETLSQSDSIVCRVKTYGAKKLTTAENLPMVEQAVWQGP